MRTERFRSPMVRAWGLRSMPRDAVMSGSSALRAEFFPMNRTCLIVQPIHPVGLEQLKAAGLTPRLATRADMVTVAREISDVTVVITRSAGLNAAAMDGAP